MTFFSTLICNAQNCPSTNICGLTSMTPSGAGTQELNSSNNGCLSIEHNSVWYTVTILTSGTLQFTIDPNINSNDFDFGVWGPNSACPPTNNPIRCSYAAVTGNTGVNTALNGGGPNSEGVFGDGWVNDITVIAGETYLILIDNFTTNGGFQLTFGGTSTLNCSFLPIELTDFKCETLSNNIMVSWSTATETNNQEFQLWRSTDAINWIKLVTKPGAGTTSSSNSYWFNDYFPPTGTYYYKLVQRDFDGTETTHDITSCSYVQNAGVAVKYYNMIGQIVNIENAAIGLYVREYTLGGFTRREVYYKTE